MSRRAALVAVVSVAGVIAAAATATADGVSLERNFAGSVQLDYMVIPTEKHGREIALDGATVELSLKLAMDFGDHVQSNVKVCVACHGLEVGMAFFDLRVADELNLRVGRFTPAFGEFPLRHDPANHRTSDKPLPYDMGRMLRLRDWNMSVLPAPWVDNGAEIDGTHFFDDSLQVDYAVYAVGGPKAAADAVDFDYKLSRTPDSYYVDNNSRPVYGAHLAWSLIGRDAMFVLGGSAMTGKYDPDRKLEFTLIGVQSTLRVFGVFLRGEYLARRTEMSLGDDPASRFKYAPGKGGRFDPYFVKEGFYGELEVPLGRFDLVGRWDGMRRRGNVVRDSELRSDSAVLRYTLGATYQIRESLRLKLSGELYDFSDFDDEVALHLGIAGPF